MEFKDLCGMHLFSGIDTGVMTYTDEYGWKDEQCNYVKFTLDNKHYIAIEDPSDGWRSCCRDLLAEATPPKFQFDGVRVVCSMMPDDDQWHEANNVMVMTDCVTGKTILEIGTKNVGDWYPAFHMEYHPENMACNIGR